MSKLSNPFDKQSFIKNHIINELNVYTDIKHPTNFFCTLAEFIAGKKKNISFLPILQTMPTSPVASSKPVTYTGRRPSINLELSDSPTTYNCKTS